MRSGICARSRRSKVRLSLGFEGVGTNLRSVGLLLSYPGSGPKLGKKRSRKQERRKLEEEKRNFEPRTEGGELRFCWFRRGI